MAAKEKNSVDKIACKHITAKDFHVKYIASRKPVIFTDSLDVIDSRWQASSKWSNEYLQKKCGESLVKVEYINKAKASSSSNENRNRFGLGKEKQIRFGDFLQSITCSSSKKQKPNEDDDDDLLYLTTQELVYDGEGRPSIVSAPLNNLREDFPLNPSLIPSLVLFNVNMWFGSSAKVRCLSHLHAFSIIHNTYSSFANKAFILGPSS